MADNIPQFENPVAGLQPQSRGGEAFAMEGRRVGMFYHQMGQDFGGDLKQLGDALVEHQTNLELANGVKSGTDMELGLEASRAQFFKDNAGPDAAAKWQQHVQDVTTQWQGHFQTERGKTFSADFGTRAYREQVQAGMGDQSEIDLATTLESRDGARQNHLAMIALDPSSADRQMAAMEQDDQHFQPALMDPGKWAQNHAAFVQEGKTLAALQYYKASSNAVYEQFRNGGTTSTAYDQSQRDLDTGKYGDLIGQHLPQLRDQLEEAKTRGQEAFHRDQEEATKASVLAGDNDFLQMYHDYNTLRNAGQPLPPDASDNIRKYEQTHPHNTTQSMELERFLTQDVKDQVHQTYVHSSGDTLTDFWQRAALPPGDPKALKPTDVTEAQHSGKLNPVDTNELLKTIAGARKDGGQGGGQQQRYWLSKGLQWWSATGRAEINPKSATDPSGLGGGSGPDPAASMAYGESTRQFIETYQALTGPGKLTPQQAFEQMTAPGSQHSFANLIPYFKAGAASGQPEDFFGANANPDKWVDTHGGWRTQGGGGRPVAGVPASGAPQARNPGETPEAWRARTGG